MKRTPLKRLSISTVSVLAGLTLVGGLLHTKAGRPLLAHLGAGCPVKASPADVEAARLDSARARRGTEAATSRRALGVALDTTTLKEGKAWAAQQGVSCEDVRAGLLRCVNLPATAIDSSGPTITKLDFGFSLGGERLVNVGVWRSGFTSPVATAQMDAIAASSKHRVGEPTTEAGRRDADYLSSGRHARRGKPRNSRCGRHFIGDFGKGRARFPPIG